MGKKVLDDLLVDRRPNKSFTQPIGRLGRSLEEHLTEIDNKERGITMKSRHLLLTLLLLFGLSGVIHAETFDQTLDKAQRGDATAQIRLAEMYSNGEGVPEDDTEAVKWYRLAAEQGNAYAQYSLGWAYANGEGVPEDDTEAVKWYRLAAEQGVAGAQFRLGVMYDYGQGVPEDDTEAVKWYRRAAEQGLVRRSI